MRIRANLLRFTLAAVGAGALHVAAAQTLAYDGFNNGPLPDLAGSTDGTGWVTSWAMTSTDVTQVQGPGLQFPGLATLPGAAVTPTAGGIWPMSIYARSFPAAPTGTTALYASFLMREDAGGGIWGGVSFGQYPSKVTVGSPLGYYTYGLMMSEGLGDVSSKPLVMGETTLVVVKIAKSSLGTGITYSLYLDPVIGSSEPSFPAATLTMGMVPNFPTAISIDNGTGFTTDEIRIGTSWVAVLPAQAPIWTDLGFAKPGIVGAPHLVGSGPLTPGSLATVTLSDANPSALTLLGIGTVAQYLPLLGGVLVPDPLIAIAQTTSPTGTASLQALWPRSATSGQPVLFQYWIQDPAATYGFSASNGLQAVSQ